ncbi:L-iditol 2-dehydrogenase [Kwoniella heveanensis CBS 569]|uniref:L-arabinitol 4-dehydrogenase n=1 Tax=Kwoniella heveanensis BCC8398 TaxID=1296120 RepID=A0A1B9GIY9_9TREE|nr:L-iditol 2-dehydrogenase [Kwoniella heveanensis BCC8398]OCF40024.1 L-iditol 2-dehydrogenase [Kwoniella heveanensis CBS 569]
MCSQHPVTQTAASAVDSAPLLSQYEAHYDPSKVLKHPEFRILEADAPELKDKEANIACAYNPAHEVHMIKKPRFKPGKGEAIVHVRSTGICGSDVHFWKHGQIGPTMVVRDECGSGHESAGEIVEIGEGVTQYKVGDRVAIEAGVPCGQADCDPCRTGRYNACQRVVFFSTPPYHGTLTRFHAHPVQWLHKLPENVSYEEGSLCEPLAVALAGIERAGVVLGDTVVICGAGPIGLVTLLAAHAAGCTPIVLTDLVESRLEFAKTLVPTVKTVKIERSWSPEEVSSKIKAAAGTSIRVALECTGFESSIRAGILSVVFGGKVFVIGVGASEMNFPFGYCSANEIDLQFQYRYANQYPKALRLVSGGLINLKPLVTHKFALEDAVKAFHVAADPSQGAIKVQIQD